MAPISVGIADSTSMPVGAQSGNTGAMSISGGGGGNTVLYLAIVAGAVVVLWLFLKRRK